MVTKKKNPTAHQLLMKLSKKGMPGVTLFIDVGSNCQKLGFLATYPDTNDFGWKDEAHFIAANAPAYLYHYIGEVGLSVSEVIGKTVKTQGWNRKENHPVTKGKEALDQVLKLFAKNSNMNATFDFSKMEDLVVKDNIQKQQSIVSACTHLAHQGSFLYAAVLSPPSMMLTSFSVSAAKGGSSPSFTDANASLSGTNSPAEENPTLINPKTKLHTQVVKICVPMTGHGMLNPIPYVTSFFTNLLLADPKAQLLSDYPAIASITKPSKIRKDAKINHFVGAPQTVGARKQYAFFLKYCLTKSLSQVKHENPKMMFWLKQKHVWVVPHLHLSMYTTNIGFIHGMHPTFSNCDMLKNTLAPYMETVEVQLVVESNFYYKNNIHFDTMVVKIQVDSDEADYARDLIAKAFFDEDFLKDISNGNPKCQLDFIPLIQKQVMGRDALCHTQLPPQT
jgi:hypothetical protein